MFPFHSVVWITSEKCFGVITNPAVVLGNRMECILISNVGFESKNLCNFNLSSTGIIDAAPMLRLFEDNVLNVQTPSTTEEEDVISLSIGVAFLNAASTMLTKCVMNKRMFPSHIFCSDLCLLTPMVKTHASPREAYNEAYHTISVLLIERDALGYMNEVAKADDFHRYPCKYRALPARTTVTRKTQSSLRTHVKHERGPRAARRKLVQSHDAPGEEEEEEEDRDEDKGDSRATKAPKLL
jgi:hypothetical protein